MPSPLHRDGDRAPRTSRLRAALRLLRHPVPIEKKRLLAERWSSLDETVRWPAQGFGRQATGCGATIGIMPRCDFDCQGCYLGDEANGIPRQSLKQSLEQLERMRAHLGPKGNVQITDGEVTLLPEEELLAVLRRARELELLPMVMTHGDTLRRKPGLLQRLVSEGGLSEISIHIDSTQRGRRDYRDAATEAELEPLRDEMANLIRAVRRETGVRLRAATTLTISRDNLGEVPEVIRWCADNADAFGLVSFQPLAQVGRTEEGLEGVSADELWGEISASLAAHGFAGGRTPLQFGHPDCTRMEMVLLAKSEGETRLVRVARPEVADDVAIVNEYLEGDLGGLCFRDDPPFARICRGLGAFLRAPAWFLGRARRWLVARAREIDPSLLRLTWRLARGKLEIQPLVIVSHHFMDSRELESTAGQERVAACVFKVPIDGEMVSMCEVNAGGRREAVYARLKESAPASSPLAAVSEAAGTAAPAP